MNNYVKFNVKGCEHFTLTEETDDCLSLFAEIEGNSLDISLIDMSELEEDDSAGIKFIPVKLITLEREYSDEELKRYIDRFQFAKTYYKRNKSIKLYTLPVVIRKDII